MIWDIIFLVSFLLGGWKGLVLFFMLLLEWELIGEWWYLWLILFFEWDEFVMLWLEYVLKIFLFNNNFGEELIFLVIFCKDFFFWLLVILINKGKR